MERRWAFVAFVVGMLSGGALAFDPDPPASASWSRDPESDPHAHVFARLNNTGRDPLAVTITFYVDGRQVDRTTLSLPSRSVHEREGPRLEPGEMATVQVETTASQARASSTMHAVAENCLGGDVVLVFEVAAGRMQTGRPDCRR